MELPRMEFPVVPASETVTLSPRWPEMMFAEPSVLPPMVLPEELLIKMPSPWLPSAALGGIDANQVALNLCSSRAVRDVHAGDIATDHVARSGSGAAKDIGAGPEELDAVGLCGG